MIATGNPSSRYEVATYYEDYSESTYFVRMNGAKKNFDERRKISNTINQSRKSYSMK